MVESVGQIEPVAEYMDIVGEVSRAVVCVGGNSHFITEDGGVCRGGERRGMHERSAEERVGCGGAIVGATFQWAGLRKELAAVARSACEGLCSRGQLARERE